MKKIREIIEKCCARFDGYWSALPLKRQRKYTLWFFGAYVLITGAVMANVWYGGRQPQGIRIDHIDNRVLTRPAPEREAADSALKTYNTKPYESERE